MATYTITIAEDTSHRVDCETACNFHEYTLHAGTYTGRQSYGLISFPIKATETRSFYINRLYWSTSIQDEACNKPATVYVSFYAWDLDEAAVNPQARWKVHGFTVTRND